MAGSKRFFTYTDDQSRLWNVELDESTYEQTVLGFGQGVSSVALTQGRRLRPGGRRQPVQMRYVLCSGTDADGRTVSRKVYVGATTAPIWTAFTNSANMPDLPDYSDPGTAQFLEDVAVTLASGENRTGIPGADTGIIDGDVDNQTPA